MGKWFSRQDIDWHYCSFQIVWLIQFSDLLDFGEWPPKSTGYIDAHLNVQNSPSLSSPHQATIETWSEVLYRLQRTGQDGKTLWDEIKNVEKFRVQYGLLSDTIDIRYLSGAAKNALVYCAGYRRRHQSYSDYKKQRKYRGKVNNHKEEDL
jgi:hypothetical protein